MKLPEILANIRLIERIKQLDNTFSDIIFYKLEKNKFASLKFKICQN